MRQPGHCHLIGDQRARNPHATVLARISQCAPNGAVHQWRKDPPASGLEGRLGRVGPVWNVSRPARVGPEGRIRARAPSETSGYSRVVRIEARPMERAS